MKLKEEIIEKIRGNQRLKINIMVAFDHCSEACLHDRLRRNDSRLTQLNILKILSEEFDIPVDELVEETI